MRPIILIFALLAVAYLACGMASNAMDTARKASQAREVAMARAMAESDASTNLARFRESLRP